MKQKLRLRDSYALTKHKLKQFKIRYISLLAVLTTMCLYAVKQASAQQAEPAATAVANIKPLQIGDTIPEYLWHLPLQVVNHPQGKDTITLNDYRDKLIILDFWATWCVPCITAFPKISRLQSDFTDQLHWLPVSREGGPVIEAFFRRDSGFFSADLVVGDTLLRSYFPHHFIPHYVWIYDNVIIATTDGDAVNSENIRQVLSNKGYSGHLKVDEMTYDKDAHFLNSGVPNFLNNLKFSSMLTGQVSGIGGRAGFAVGGDSTWVRAYFTNKDILSLYSACYRKKFYNRVVIDPALLPRIIANKADLKGWQEENLFCYEHTYPASYTDEIRRKMMLRDLNHYFGLRGRMEVRNIDCWLITELAPEIEEETRTAESTHLSRQLSLRELCDEYTRSLSIYSLDPIVLCEINPTEKLYVIPNHVKDFDTLAEVLEQNGYQLEAAARRLQVFVLSNK